MIDKESPIILTGNQRTSTTFFANHFMKSPHFSFGSEEGLIRNLLIWFELYRDQPELLPYARFNEFLHMLKARVSPHHIKQSEELRKIFRNLRKSGELKRIVERHNVNELIQTICGIAAQRKNAKALFWGDKYPEYLFQLDDINRTFPRAKFIVMMRHPYSNVEALSRKISKNGLGKLVDNVDDCIEQYITWNNRWLGYKPQLTKNRYIEVKYEELMLNTWATLKRVNEFIGHEVFTVAMSERFTDRVDISKVLLTSDHKDFEKVSDLCKRSAELTEISIKLNYSMT
jgi:hypothetical protein